MSIASEIDGPEIKGWCPGALRPMLSGDGWVLRVRPVGGRLTPEQAMGVAALAGKHGNGLIDLSSRANLQIRGVSEDAIADLVAGLSALGLIDPTPAAEARRNIVLTPFWRSGDVAPAVANALAEALADGPDLPGKFGFAVDCGDAPVLRDVSADIRIEGSANGAFLVCADGAERGAEVSAAEAPEAALSLAHWFAASGGMQDGRGRMARHLADGAELPERFRQVPVRVAKPLQVAPGRQDMGYLVGLAFGQIGATALGELAGYGPLRMTPWRMVLVEGVIEAPALPGLITDPADPMLRVVACTGAPGCPQAKQPTREIARTLALHVPAGSVLHVSGCAKGCAHPKAADLTLVAGAEGYCAIRDGRASDPVRGPAMTVSELKAHPELLIGTH